MARDLTPLFWFIALTGLTPAIFTNLVFPFEWTFLKLEYPFLDVFSAPNLISSSLTPAIFTGLFVVGITICIHQRMIWGVIPLLPLILIDLGRSADAGFFSVLQQAAYAFSCFLAYLAFILKGHMRSWYFALHTVLLLVTLFLERQFGLTFLFEPLLAYRNVLLWLFCCLVGRIGVRLYLENIGLFRDLGWRRTAQLFARTLMLWWPILIFIIPGAILSWQIGNRVEAFVYSEEIIYYKGIEQASDRDLRTDIDRTVDHRLNRTEAQLQGTIDGMPDRIGRDGKLLREAGLEAFDESVPDNLGLNTTRECDLLKIGNCIRNAINRGIESGYDGARNRKRKELAQSLADMNADTVAESRRRADDAKDLVTQNVLHTRAALTAIITNIYQLIDFANLLLTFFLILAVIKSLMLVFSRVVFAREGGQFVEFSDPDLARAAGSMKKCGERYSIPGNSNTRYYNIRRYKPVGSAPSFAVPQPVKSVFARLRHLAWAMNEIDMKENSAAVTFSSVRGAQFVEWDLKKGERVLFSYENLAAFSETVKLSTYISLKIATLVMGRLIYAQAEGPGKIVFRTWGNPIIKGDRDSGKDMPAYRLIAWNRRSRFSVRSNIKITDIFFSGIHVQKQKADLVLADADYGGRVVGGIGRFIKSFLLPI